MNFAPIIIPTLNRCDHLKACLESLNNNHNAENTEVFVSVDYPPSEKYIDLMEKKVRALSNRDFKFIRLDRPPVVGCINWIFQDYL